jgi:hypothetical protein
MTPDNRLQRTALPRRRWGSGERQRVELRAAPPGGFALDKHVPSATLTSHASPIVILTALHEVLTERGGRYIVKLVD